MIWFAHKDNYIIKILSSKILVGIGLISYSLYLWHYPIFAFSRIRFTGLINDVYTKELIILFTLIILSIFTYFFIEKPSRNKKNKFRFVAIPSLSLMILFIIFSFKVIKNNGYENRFFTATNYKLSSFSYLNEFNNYTVNYNYDDYSDNKTNVLIVGNSFSLNYLQILNETNLTKNFYFNHAGPKIRNKNNNYQVHYFLDYLVNNVAHTDGKYDNFLDHLNKQYELSEIIILGTVWSQLDINSIVQINHKLKEDKKKLIVFDHSICSKPKLSYGFNRLDYFVYINKRLPNETELFKLEEELFYDYNQKTCYQQVIKNLNNQIHKITSENNINILKMRDIFCNLESKRCPLLTKEGFKIYWDWGHLTLEGSKYFSKRFEKNKDFIFLLNK